jgi:protein TonB
VSSPVVIHSVDPEFTQAARKAKVSGVVLVNLIVDQNGQPQNVHVLRGLVGPDGKPDPKVPKEVADEVGQKAVDAVKQYKFKPAMEAGKPVAVQLNVEVNFQVF